MADADASRALASDLLLVGGVAAGLVALHYLLPPGVRTDLAFDHRRLWSPGLLTSAYVHTGAAHLWSNVGGYLSVAVVTALLCHQAGRARWFRRTFLALLVALPPLTNLTSWAVLRYGLGVGHVTSYGFSGVVAGTGGFLFVALLALVRPVYGRDVTLYLGEFVVVLLLAETYLIYADAVPAAHAVVLVVGLLLPLSGLGWTVARAGGPAVDRSRLAVDATYAGLVVLLLVALVFGLFPARLLTDGTLTNVVAHAAGFVWGAVLAGWTASVTVE